MATDTTAPSIISDATIFQATHIRRIFAYLSSFLFLITLIFLILVEIGNINSNHPVLPSIYFIKLDLTNIIPRSVPNFQLVNSIARTLGLHDFYQVGVWNYCAGYGNEVTECSTPQKLYWFNPVEILLSELLAGASIALPSQITDALDLVRTASRWMFAFFLTGACLALPTALPGSVIHLHPLGITPADHLDFSGRLHHHRRLSNCHGNVSDLQERRPERRRDGQHPSRDRYQDVCLHVGCCWSSYPGFPDPFCAMLLLRQCERCENRSAQGS